jgi:hypothetical protein
VKQISISFIASDGKSYPNKIYRYNTLGQLVYSSEGTPSYYYSFRYDSAGRMSWSDQRSMNGKLIAGYGFTYFPSGKMKHTSYYNEYDSIHPYEVVTLDTAGNRIADVNYINAKFFRGSFKTFDNDHNMISATDSTVFGDSGKVNVYFTEDKLLRRYSEYKKNGVDNWKFRYDSTGVLILVLHQSGNRFETYDLKYDKSGDYSLNVNGNKAQPAQDKFFHDKWDYLIPKKMWPIDRLPYSDPVPEEKWNHEITRGKNGNITKDVITPGAEWMQKETVTYTYEYEYWK